MATALAAAMAEAHGDPAPESPASDVTRALLQLRDDQENVATYIKDVVFADDDEPIAYRDLARTSDREIVCIDLTDGGTVWVYDLDGEPRWLPDEEFERRVDEDDDIAAHESMAAVLSMVLLALILGAAVVVALWYVILPSGH